MQKHKIVVSNRSPGELTLWLEPWGEDYVMSPEETFEVVAEECAGDFYFQLDYQEGAVLVWAEGDARSVNVWQGGQMLMCGHNRHEGEMPLPGGT